MVNNKSFWNKLNKFKISCDNSSTTNCDGCRMIELTDGSKLSIKLVKSLLEEHSYYVSLIEEYDKECDYNRLLKKENQDLMSYIYETQQVDDGEFFDDMDYDEEDDYTLSDIMLSDKNNKLLS